MNKAYDIDTEWGMGYSWWAGPHDLVPVPNQRKFLMSNDIGLFEFDIARGELVAEFEEIIEKYMKGFEVTTDDRRGYNREGEWQELPESDLKSFNLAPGGSFIMCSRFSESFGASIPAWWLMGSARRSTLVMKSTGRGGMGKLTAVQSPSKRVRDDENLDEVEMC